MFIHSGPMNWLFAVCRHSRKAPLTASLSFDVVSHWGEYTNPTAPPHRSWGSAFGPWLQPTTRLLPKDENLKLALQAVFHLLEQLCFCPIGISVMLINDVSLAV